MNAEPDSTTQASLQGAASAIDVGDKEPGAAVPALFACLSEELPEGSLRIGAQAPGRLDVMGGLAEYTGSLVLAMPIADQVCVGVQVRTDGILSITVAQPPHGDGNPPHKMAASQLLSADGAVINAEQGRQLMQGTCPPPMLCVLGTVVELARSQLIGSLKDGFSIAVSSTLDGLRDAGRPAATAAATATALAMLGKKTVAAKDLAALCQRVENEWLQNPVGMADALCALSGVPSALLEIHSDTGIADRTIPLPAQLTLMGIDCGARNSDADLRYERVRTAAFMGRALIDRIIRHGGTGDLTWSGFLARIAVTDYVERFRDRLPTKLKGSEYLKRFGETGDPLTQVDPGFTYKIRSRTEHHIYEHARACQFAQCLARAIRNGDERALHEAGELMYASHWSYGQRCGLGCAESDLLVNLIRKCGADAGVYGAKISARGCGGVVTILMQSTERAAAAVDQALELYEAQSGRDASVIRGSSEGALVSGACRGACRF